MAATHATRLIPQRAAQLELGLEPALDRAQTRYVVLDLLAIADDPIVSDDQELERPERRQLLLDGFALVEELQVDAGLYRLHSQQVSLVG